MEMKDILIDEYKMNSAKVIQVIESHVKRGNGTEDNPFRIITLYWSLGGELLAVYDPYINT